MTVRPSTPALLRLAAGVCALALIQVDRIAYWCGAKSLAGIAFRGATRIAVATGIPLHPEDSP